MATLKIVRDSGYADRLRAYQVILDGEKVGAIKEGQTQEFRIAAGSHEVSLKIDWCGSKAIRFTAAGEDQLTLQAKSNLRGPKLVSVLWYVIFDRNSYLLLERNA